MSIRVTGKAALSFDYELSLNISPEQFMALSREERERLIDKEMPWDLIREYCQADVHIAVKTICRQQKNRPGRSGFRNALENKFVQQL